MYSETVQELCMKYSATELREALFSFKKSKGKHMRVPIDIYDLLKPYTMEDQEYFLIVTLNGAHEVINVHEVTKGLVNRTLIHPREVFKHAIRDNSTAIVAAHNHPSGNVTASLEDREITTSLRAAGKILGIQILDHLVIGSDGFYSFQENGDL